MLYFLLLKIVPVKEGRAGTLAGVAEENPYAPLPASSAEREPLLSPTLSASATITETSNNDGDEVNISVSPQSAERCFHQQWNAPSP